MRPLSSKQWVLNRNDPDAKGLVIALPLTEGGGWVSGVRERTGRFPIKFTAQAGLLDSDSVVMPWGRALSLNGTKYLSQPTSNIAGSNGLSMSCRVVVKAAGTVDEGILTCSAGWIIHGTASFASNFAIRLAGTTGVSLGTVPTIGQMYTIGVRFTVGSSNVDAFLDGVKLATLAVGGNYTSASEVLCVGTRPDIVGRATNCNIGDVRVWNRVMPDATFERAYTRPLGLYLPTRKVLRAQVGGGSASMFFPFLHPSLQG